MAFRDPRIRQQVAARRVRVRAVIADHLRIHPCVDCGEDDPVVLEFDHVRGEKLFEISRADNNCVSIATLRREIVKCEVRCANCHRRKTHERRLAEKTVRETNDVESQLILF